MKVTVRVAKYEQNGQSTGVIHLTVMSVSLGWGLGWILGNEDMNLFTNLRLCCSDDFAFLGGGGGGGSLAAILRLRLGGLSSLGGAEVVEVVIREE